MTDNNMETGLEMSRSADIIERMWDFSEKICKAKFIPPAAQGDPASVFFLISTAQELGLRWTHGLRSLYMTPDGKVGLQGDIIMALLLKQGFQVEFPEMSPQRATCRITRPNGGGSLEWSFSIQDAEKIKRWDKQAGRWVSLAEKHNYKSYPQNMLMWRALANCARFIAADVMGGVYLPEELEEVAEVQAADSVPETEALPQPGETASPVGVKKLPQAKEPQADPQAPPKPVLQPEPPAEQPAAQAQPEPEPDEAPSETEDEEERFRAEFNEIAAKLGGGNPEIGSKIIGRFFRGYLNIARGAMPRGYQNYVGAMNALKAVLDTETKDLLADPLAFGNKLRNRKDEPDANPAEKRMSELGWPEPVKELGRSIMAKLQQKPAQFVRWIDTPILPDRPLSSFSHQDLQAFFRLYLIALGDAWDLAEISMQKGIPLAELVATLERITKKQLAEWDLDFYHSVVEQIKKESEDKSSDGQQPTQEQQGDDFLLMP